MKAAIIALLLSGCAMLPCEKEAKPLVLEYCVSW